jgi:orotate phosphoribosyltransferase
MSFPEVRECVAESIVAVIRQHFPDAEIIAGAAIGGVPHAAWVAQKMRLPMIYVRSEAKTHGKMNLIEGVLPSNSKVVLIEDTVSTGKSAINAVKAIRSSRSNPLGVIAIFSYELPISEKIFRENKIPFFALCNYSCVIETARRSNYMNDAQLEKLKKWKRDS